LPAIPCADGSIPRRKSRPTPQGERAPDQLLELADEVRTSDVSHAVVAVPGRVDYRAGRLEYAPNLSKHWTEKLRVDYLEEKLGLDVALANDADAAAVGEAYFGAGRCYDDVAYLTVSTGIGAGVVRRVPRIQLFPFRATGSVLVGPQCAAAVPEGGEDQASRLFPACGVDDGSIEAGSTTTPSMRRRLASERVSADPRL
jgi:hypothetical protein